MSTVKHFIFTCIFLLLVYPFAFAQAARPVSQQPGACPGFETRLQVNTYGRVTPGDPNNLRDQPNTGANKIGQIPGGDSFYILDGPRCANNITWWQVDYQGVVGWTGEGKVGEIWAVPDRPINQPPTATSRPRPIATSVPQQGNLAPSNDDPLCTPLVEEAVGQATDQCINIGQNQVCYGNDTVAVQPNDSTRTLNFDSPGDMVQIHQLSSIRLSSGELGAEQWGIALMSLQAEVRNPETAADTTIVLFGEVEVADTSDEYKDGVPAFVNVGNGILYVRSEPSFNARSLARLTEGTRLNVVGGPRVEEGSTWWEITAPNDVRGWAVDNFEGQQTIVFYSIGRLVPEGRATVFTTEGDFLNVRSGPGLEHEWLGSIPNETRVSILEGPTTSSDGLKWWRVRGPNGLTGWSTDFIDGLPTLSTYSQGPRFGAMQAFSINTDRGTLECEQAPNGILIQTPEGQSEVRLLVNEVAIQLNATVYIESEVQDELTVNVLEGAARVEAGGVGRIVPEGARVNIPIGNSYQITGPVSFLEPYDEAKMRNLPLNLLKRPIQPAPAGINLGAGLGSGDVQVTLAWDNDADMDVSVTEPNGNVVWYGDRFSSTGGQLDIDSNFPCGTNLGSVENIFWPLNRSPNGNFIVTVNEYSTCGDGDAQWYLIVRVDGIVVLQESGIGGYQEYSFYR